MRKKDKKRVVPDADLCYNNRVNYHHITVRRDNRLQNNFITAKPVRQYVRAKGYNMALAESLRRLGDRRWANVANCSQALGIKYCPTCGIQHVEVSWCCRHRLCSVCALRRSRKTGRQALDAFHFMQDQGQLDGATLWLLTLTQRNVSADDLGAELDKLLAALQSVRHVRDVRRCLIGSARNIEVTYNHVRKTFHPHVHIILILSPDAPEEMKNFLYWRNLWMRLMHLDYDPICDLRPIEDQVGAICEVSKYCIKPSSIFGLQLPPAQLDQVVHTLNGVLAGRRLVSYTGIWRKARLALKQREPDEDLEHDDTRDICGCGAALMDAVLRWDGLQYNDLPSPL